MSQFEDYPRRGEREYDEDRADEYTRRRLSRCQCRHMDMPGFCPGVSQCPLAAPEDDDDA